MEFDGGRHTPGETIDADCCIIGAGPAGLVVASALAEGGRDVVVLESGATFSDPGAQALNAGDVEGDSYAGLRVTRHRSVGGTSAVWNTPTRRGPGAKYAPLDRWDLAPRWSEAPDGWPFSFAALEPYYARAQRTCGLGPFAYEASAWSDSGSADIADSAAIVSRVYQFGGREALVAPLLAVLGRSPNARMYTGATVVQLTVERTGVVLTVARSTGARWSVRARRVVLAGGAVENARLLLVSAAAGSGVHDRSGWLGRGFMEHPRDRTLSFVPPSPASWKALAFYDVHSAADGTAIVGRLGLAAGGNASPGEGMLNASATLLPNVIPWRTRVRGALGRVGTLRALQRWLPAGGHGWSLHPSPERVLSGGTVLLNVEQPPHRDNAIVLGARRDVFGVPLPVLRWQWSREDHARLIRLRAEFARALELAGLGRVTIGADVPPDPNAHHHAGTTRMHSEARHGVVDAEGRVFGAESLSVVGASTFPTSGFANPTLTIVAMALRLADRLLAEG